MSKFKGHPFESNYGVIKAAFDSLEKKNLDDLMVIRGYKGVTAEAYEQLQYEKQRIAEVRFLLDKLLEEHYKNNTTIQYI